MTGTSDSDRPIVRISAIEHYQYCPRQCALIHVDGMWVDNQHTVRGATGHRRADEASARQERGWKVVRHLPLWSERWGLEGRADIVEFRGDIIRPVEYKIGTRHGAAAAMQLCAQALCLEEMFSTTVPSGFIWYSAERRRTGVSFDDDLRQTTLDAIVAIRAQWFEDTLPRAVDDARCLSCQFLDPCLPSLTGHPDALTRWIYKALR